MNLPIIEYPTFELIIPSTKETIRYRPFLVREEKILLMAQQSSNINDLMYAVKQIIINCVITAGFDIDKLMVFDVEYIFLKLRANSVNNQINLTYKDGEDDKNYTVSLDLNTVEVEFRPDHSNKIKINETTYLFLKYPGLTVSDKMMNVTSPEQAFMEMVKSCLDKLMSGEELFYFKDEKEEDIDKFIDSLPIPTFDAIKTFFETMPKLRHILKYTNSLGHEQEIVLETLNDFFTLR